MALPSTGSISMSQVNTELKKSATATISLNDSAVRKLAGKTSGTISMNDLRGKKASESVTNYQIYSNEWLADDKKGSFSFSFPKKVISGIIIVKSTWRIAYHDVRDKYPGYIEILGHTIKQTTKNISIANSSSISGKYNTGYGIDVMDSNGIRPSVAGVVTVDIKFTGEWEA